MQLIRMLHTDTCSGKKSSYAMHCVTNTAMFVGLGAGGDAGGCNRSRGQGWESEDRKAEEEGCDEEDGILDDGKGGDTEEDEEGRL